MADESLIKKRKLEDDDGFDGGDKLVRIEKKIDKAKELDVLEDCSKSEDDDSIGGEDEGDEEFDSDQEFINKEIEVEFAAFDPNNDDFHGIKCLLQRLWLKENIDLSEMSELIIHSDTIASVLKQENEDDEGEEEESKKDQEQPTSNGGIDEGEKHEVYGVISLIPLNDHFLAKKCMQQVKQLLLSYIPGENAIHKTLVGSKCAFIINERFLNLPPKISTPCYTELISEVNTYANTNIDYGFDYVLMICKTLKNKNNAKEVIYINAEDELFAEAAMATFEYSVSSQCDSDVFDWSDDENLYEPFRQVLLLSKDKWIQTVDRLKELV